MELKINKKNLNRYPECKAINSLKLPLSSGFVIFLCVNCGAEIHLVFYRMLLDVRLRHQRSFKKEVDSLSFCILQGENTV